MNTKKALKGAFLFATSLWQTPSGLARKCAPGTFLFATSLWQTLQGLTRKCAPGAFLFATSLWQTLQGLTRKCAPGALLFALVFALPAWAGNADCRLGGAAETVIVQSANDGDTLTLSDGRRLRLLNIDAPEIDHEQPSESLPGSREARTALHNLAPKGTRLTVHIDRNGKDRFDRLLGQALLPDGQDLALNLLEQGAVFLFVLPPNTTLAECYARAQSRARQAGRGVWALPTYQPQDTLEVRAAPKQILRVRGRVTRLDFSVHGATALLDDRLSVQLPKGFRAKGLEGRLIEAQGRLTQRDGRPHISLQHASALYVVRE